MREGLHGDCCFTPSWPTLPTSEGLVHVPADDAAWAAHTTRPRTAASAVFAARLSDAEAKAIGWIAMIIAVVGAFRVGAAVLALGSTDTTGTPATTTMTETAPNDEPTEEPTAAGFTPRKSDFEIKILEKKCLGSAGCSVTDRIKPKYVGTQELN
jgi:hypothetical protein